jgi:hypothetical protein
MLQHFVIKAKIVSLMDVNDITSEKRAEHSLLTDSINNTVYIAKVCGVERQ